MAKKSITPSFRLNEDDYLKFKELKEKYNLSWTKFIEYSNKLIENDMKKWEINHEQKIDSSTTANTANI